MACHHLTSCDFAFCPTTDKSSAEYIKSIQTPSTCNFNTYLDCHYKPVFTTPRTEPSNKTGFNLINPHTISNAYAPEFIKVPCKEPNFPNEVYTSSDPRLISAYHNGQKLGLDVPPIDHYVGMNNVYTNPSIPNFKSFYKNYDDIKAGQIMYYTNKSLEDNLFAPVFENPSKVTGVMYKDPMGGTYPEYIRDPKIKDNVLNTVNRKYRYGLSSINDENEFREDIIHLQMRPQDRMRYSTRWA